MFFSSFILIKFYLLIRKNETGIIKCHDNTVPSLFFRFYSKISKKLHFRLAKLLKKEYNVG